MPGVTRKPGDKPDDKPATDEKLDTVSDEAVDPIDTEPTEPEEPQEEEMNPVKVPDNWEKVPDEHGGGIRPTQVPWPGYENA